MLTRRAQGRAQRAGQPQARVDGAPAPRSVSFGVRSARTALRCVPHDARMPRLLLGSAHARARALRTREPGAQSRRIVRPPHRRGDRWLLQRNLATPCPCPCYISSRCASPATDSMRGPHANPREDQRAFRARPAPRPKITPSVRPSWQRRYGAGYCCRLHTSEGGGGDGLGGGFVPSAASSTTSIACARSERGVEGVSSREIKGRRPQVDRTHFGREGQREKGRPHK